MKRASAIEHQVDDFEAKVTFFRDVLESGELLG
jgi:hypothetical protein